VKRHSFLAGGKVAATPQVPLDRTASIHDRLGLGALRGSEHAGPLNTRSPGWVDSAMDNFQTAGVENHMSADVFLGDVPCSRAGESRGTPPSGATSHPRRNHSLAPKVFISPLTFQGLQRGKVASADASFRGPQVRTPGS
jgi:hypothetical protein